MEVCPGKMVDTIGADYFFVFEQVLSACYAKFRKEQTKQIIEIIQWFHTSFYKSNKKQEISFYYSVLYYLWDEWLNIEEQKMLSISTLSNNSQFIKENQYIYGKITINRFIDSKTNTIQFICN